jgi:hypothetical protein
MQNNQKWSLAFALLRGFGGNLPAVPTEDDVAQYHSILESLQEAGELDLTPFRIDPARVNQRAEGGRRAAFGHPGTGRVFYSTKKYCELAHFTTQIESLMLFLQDNQSQSKPPREIPDNEAAYRALTDGQITQIAAQRRIKAKKVVGPSGEKFEFDREHFIAAFLRDDMKSEGFPPVPVSQYNIHVEHMSNSALMQGSHGSTINQQFDMQGQDFKNFLTDLRSKLSEVPLPVGDRAQANADLNSVEAQIAAPRPKYAVIRECILSIRTILEIAAGDVIAMGLLTQIAHYFPK